MKVPLLQSRRFWMMLVDVVVSTITFLITGYFSLDPKTVDLVKFAVVTLQPVIIAVIFAYTVDDTNQAILAHKMDVVKLQQAPVQNVGQGYVSSGTPPVQ